VETHVSCASIGVVLRAFVQQQRAIHVSHGSRRRLGGAFDFLAHLLFNLLTESLCFLRDPTLPALCAQVAMRFSFFRLVSTPLLPTCGPSYAFRLRQRRVILITTAATTAA
jgi:hypothetical protein